MCGEVGRIEAGVSRDHARRAGHEGDEEYHLGLLDGPHRLAPSRGEDSNGWGCAARKVGSQCKLLWRSGRPRVSAATRHHREAHEERPHSVLLHEAAQNGLGGAFRADTSDDYYCTHRAFVTGCEGPSIAELRNVPVV